MNFSFQTGTDASVISQMSSTDTTTAPTMSLIMGIYTFESEENFQNYLSKLGVPYVLRSLASMATPVVTISKDCKVPNHFCCNGRGLNVTNLTQQDTPADRDTGDEGCDWTIRTDTLFKSHTLK